ncbi:unnamed protein product [Rotaria sp. Silwood2]|nr:unnamed protein product [Rotaria sp. Silwood2]
MAILLGRDDAVFQNQITFSIGSTSKSLSIGDFNKDIIMDLIIATYGNDSVGVFHGFGDESLSSQKTLMTGLKSQSYNVAIIDFNSDNSFDIIVINYGSNKIGIFLGYGNINKDEYNLKLVLQNFQHKNLLSVLCFTPAAFKA